MQTSTTPVNIGTPTTNTTAADSTIAGTKSFSEGVQDTIKQSNEALAASQTPEQKAQSTLLEEAKKLIGDTAGQAAMLAEEEKKRNIEGMNTQLSGINSQITTGLAEYEQLKKAFDMQYYQTTIANRGQAVPMSKIIGNQAQIDLKRQFDDASVLSAKAGDIGLLQAQALGLQGQIEAAQKAAQKAVEVKYAPILEQLSIKTQQLALIQPLLDKQEKIQAAALQMQYDAQKQATTDAKATEQQRIDLALSYMQKYPQANVSINDSYESMQAKVAGLPTTTGLTEVSPGATLYDPVTGKAVYTAPTAKQLSGTSGGGAGKTITVGSQKILETGDTFTDTINYLKALRDQGMLRDINYREQINALMALGGYTEEQRGEVESMVNKAMESSMPQSDDNNPASDFEISSGGGW